MPSIVNTAVISKQPLIQYIRSYLPYWRPFLHPQREDAPCCDDRDPLITGPYNIENKKYSISIIWHTDSSSSSWRGGGDVRSSYSSKTYNNDSSQNSIVGLDVCYEMF